MLEGLEMTFALLSGSFIIIALWIRNSEFFCGENSLLKKKSQATCSRELFGKFPKNHHTLGKKLMKSLRLLKDSGTFLAFFF